MNSRASAYIRVSGESQADNTSLEFQRRQIEGYALMRSLELVSVIEDNGVSGGQLIGERPGGASLVDLIERGEVGAVIVTKLDRAFRDAEDCLHVVKDWDARGIALHIIDLGGSSIDTTTPAGRFMLTVLAAAAEMERGMIRDRCNSGRRVKQAQGFRVGEIPYGFDLEPNTKKLLQSVTEQQVIADILSLHGRGHSLRAIAGELNRRGVRTKKGCEWAAAQIGRVVKKAA